MPGPHQQLLPFLLFYRFGLSSILLPGSNTTGFKPSRFQLMAQFICLGYNLNKTPLKCQNQAFVVPQVVFLNSPRQSAYQIRFLHETRERGKGLFALFSFSSDPASSCRPAKPFQPPQRSGSGAPSPRAEQLPAAARLGIAEGLWHPPKNRLIFSSLLGLREPNKSRPIPNLKAEAALNTHGKRSARKGAADLQSTITPSQHTYKASPFPPPRPVDV